VVSTGELLPSGEKRMCGHHYIRHMSRAREFSLLAYAQKSYMLVTCRMHARSCSQASIMYATVCTWRKNRDSGYSQVPVRIMVKSHLVTSAGKVDGPRHNDDRNAVFA
jgi:hypothetical protein